MTLPIPLKSSLSLFFRTGKARLHSITVSCLSAWLFSLNKDGCAAGLNSLHTKSKFQQKCDQGSWIWLTGSYFTSKSLHGMSRNDKRSGKEHCCPPFLLLCKFHLRAFLFPRLMMRFLQSFSFAPVWFQGAVVLALTCYRDEGGGQTWCPSPPHVLVTNPLGHSWQSSSFSTTKTSRVKLQFVSLLQLHADEIHDFIAIFLIERLFCLQMRKVDTKVTHAVLMCGE